MKLGPLYHTGIILSLNAASLATVCTVLAFGEWSAGYFLLVYLITYAVYGLDRLTGIDEDLASQPERTRFLERWRRPFAASIALSFLGGLLLAAGAGWVAALVPVAPAVIVLYSGNVSFRLFHFRGPDLKQYFLVKDAAIASGWAFLLPLGALYLGRPMGTGAWIFLLPLFIKLFVMAAIYDFKDIDSDRKAGVRTLPVVLGEKNSRAALHILNAAATAGMVALVAAGILPLLGLIFLPAFLYAAVLIHLSRRDAPGWVFFVVADLEQFFWLACAGTWGWAAGVL